MHNLISTASHFLLIAATLLDVGSNAFASGPILRAGAAKVDITPILGVSLDGPISKNGPVTGVYDRLHARALVFDDGETRLVIVVCDACMIGRFAVVSNDAAFSTSDCSRLGGGLCHALRRFERTSAGGWPLRIAVPESRFAERLAQNVLTVAVRNLSFSWFPLLPSNIVNTFVSSWQYKDAFGRTVGRVSALEIRDLVASGELSLDTLILHPMSTAIAIKTHFRDATVRH